MKRGGGVILVNSQISWHKLVIIGSDKLCEGWLFKFCATKNIYLQVEFIVIASCLSFAA